MEAQLLVMVVPLFLQIFKTIAEIQGSPTLNKLISTPPKGTPVPPIQKIIPIDIIKKIKPVGAPIAKNFIPLTEIPPPHLPLVHSHNGRRHMDPDCNTPTPREVYDGARVEIWGDYYEERFAKTVATVVFPDHIDRKHFEVTTQVPYLTVGPIDGIGYHPSTIKSEHPSECEKIYQDHLAEQYSDETKDFSEESLEMARMPLFPPQGSVKEIDTEAEADMYEDVSA